MRRTNYAAVASFVLGTQCSAVVAADMPPCPNDYFIPLMMVPNKQVAESIFRAVGGTLAPWNVKKFPVVTVDDKGDYWAVYQTTGDPPPRATPGTVLISRGGGALYLEMNKCTGAISHAEFEH
jgi:hypothetical protein